MTWGMFLPAAAMTAACIATTGIATGISACITTAGAAAAAGITATGVAAGTA